MQGVALLLLLCVAAVVTVGIALVAVLVRDGHERAGYYGRSLRERRQQHDVQASMIASLLAADETDQLAELVGVLDRLAWSGVPMTQVRPSHDDDAWHLDFRDGTALRVRTANARAMRRAGDLARREALVVGRVLPVDGAAVVSLSTPRHAPLRVALRA